MGDNPQPAGVNLVEQLKDIKIDALPGILNFDEEKTPLLVETHERVIETVKQQGPRKAEAVAATYERIAQDNLAEQLDDSRKNAPPDYHRRELSKAYAGLLINVAKIWRDAGVPEKCLESLERAIAFARRNRWASVVTALENERNKLMPRGV